MHPDLAQAKEGYEDEERRGIPVDAPHRNYKDANHKPELVCALTEFDGLCGFRDPDQAAGLLDGLGVDPSSRMSTCCTRTLRTRPCARC
ncbi:hypothetical protein SGLAM104S_01997 [Streptomyces glaucescens]